MSKMELEIKILDIDKNDLIKKIESLGGKLLFDDYQYIYTYDLMSIYGRFVDILTLLNNSENEIKNEMNFARLKNLFWEVDNLLNEEDRSRLKEIVGYDLTLDILHDEEYLELLNKDEMLDFMFNFHNNRKKWIRLRKSKDKTTIAIKHILKSNNSNIQQMKEIEVEVNSFDEANEFLEALGFSHKSHQVKKRISYVLNKVEIDIDEWPKIPPFMELEGNLQEMEKVLENLGYRMEEAISCTGDEVYQKYGIDSLSMRELKFEE